MSILNRSVRSKKDKELSQLLAQNEFKIHDHIKRENRFIVVSTLGLMTLGVVLGIILIGPLGLMMSGIALVGACYIGRETGLFDNDWQRQARIEAKLYPHTSLEPFKEVPKPDVLIGSKIEEAVIRPLKRAADELSASNEPIIKKRKSLSH